MFLAPLCFARYVFPFNLVWHTKTSATVAITGDVMDAIFAMLVHALMLSVIDERCDENLRSVRANYS